MLTAISSTKSVPAQIPVGDFCVQSIREVDESGLMVVVSSSGDVILSCDKLKKSLGASTINGDVVIDIGNETKEIVKALIVSWDAHIKNSSDWPSLSHLSYCHLFTKFSSFVGSAAVRPVFVRGRLHAKLYLTETVLSSNNEERFSAVGEVIRDLESAILVVDENFIISNCNESFCSLVRYARNDLEGKHVHSLFDIDGCDLRSIAQNPTEKRSIVCEVATPAGNSIPIVLSVSPVCSSKGYLFVAEKLDDAVTDDRRSDIWKDSLTGLMTGPKFISSLENALANGGADDCPCGVFIIDINQLSAINDSFGRKAGDSVILECVNRISDALSLGDLVCRYGSDEFIVAKHGLCSAYDLDVFCESLETALNRPVSIGGVVVDLKTTIGISLFPEHGTQAEKLICNAEIAMNAAKLDFVGMRHYDAKTMSRGVNTAVVCHELKNAVSNNMLDLFLQKKVSLSTNRTVGYELLLRWQHEEMGSVSPSVFIPIAERNGFINEIWLRSYFEICRELRRLLDANESVLPISINISPVQIMTNTRLVEEAISTVKKFNIPPSLIEFEITESFLIKDRFQVKSVFDKIVSAGFGLALDDFGAGYSNISYISDFQFSTIKLDMIFLAEIEFNQRSRKLVQAVINLSQAMGANVVAEGVSSAEQALILREMGCDSAQGYYYGAPVLYSEYLGTK